MPVSTVSTSRAVRYVARRGTSVSGVSDLPVASERPARLDVGIVGTGRVGAVLGAALQKAGHRLVAVSGVSELSRERAAALLPGIPVMSVEEVVTRAELVLLTVPDDVLPGLIDCHIHMQGTGDPKQERLDEAHKGGEDSLVDAVRNARTDLLAGFTSVRDLGGDAAVLRALKSGIADHVFEGPTIMMAAEMVSVTAGHGDGSATLREDFARTVRASADNVCDGIDSCRRAVRAQIRDGAEVIKFAATGGVLDPVASGLGQHMTFDEMKAVIDTAHQFGRKAAAHVKRDRLRRGYGFGLKNRPGDRGIEPVHGLSVPPGIRCASTMIWIKESPSCSFTDTWLSPAE